MKAKKKQRKCTKKKIHVQKPEKKNRLLIVPFDYRIVLHVITIDLSLSIFFFTFLFFCFVESRLLLVYMFLCITSVMAAIRNSQKINNKINKGKKVEINRCELLSVNSDKNEKYLY